MSQKVDVFPYADGAEVVIVNRWNRAVSTERFVLHNRRKVETLYRKIGRLLERGRGSG